MSTFKTVPRLIATLYGLACYAMFLVVILYSIGFVSGLFVPKTIDSGTVVPVGQAVIINLVLLTIFALQHSVMARQPFKRWWTKFVPEPIERSTYVLFANLSLALLLWQWRPMPTVVWEVTNPQLAMAVLAFSFFGWAIVFLSTFLINHFELFGLSQVIRNLRGTPTPKAHFSTPFLYGLVRHPLYLGFLIAFWSAPVMTQGHLLFAAVTTAYILVAIAFEERDLVGLFGDEYRRYQQRVSMLIPFWPKS